MNEMYAEWLVKRKTPAYMMLVKILMVLVCVVAFFIEMCIRDRYLNELTARHTGKTVYAGPGEATAIGNLLAQMITAGEFKGLGDARSAVYRSFETKTYTKVT